MVISRKLYAALAVPALTLAACGSSGGGSDKDKITSIVNGVAKDPSSLCQHMAPALLKQIGGDAKCKAAAKADPTGPDKSTKVESIKITGDTAVANVKDKSGKTAVKFVKVGGDWKLTQ